MSDLENLRLPESHFNILQILSALAWADGDLSQKEIKILLEEFKEDLPVEPQAISLIDNTGIANLNLEQEAFAFEQMEKRINAELAFQQIIENYHQNPIPLTDLVSKLKTSEDRSLTVKLAYMLICVSYDSKTQTIPLVEKALYRELIQLLNLDNNLVKEIEWEAKKELDEFQHPFKAFITSIGNILNTKI